MLEMISRLLVVLTALSTVLADIPPSVTADIALAGSVAAQQPAGDDDPGTPRSEREAEESEFENELEIKLLAERTDVSGPQADTFLPVEIMPGGHGHRVVRATAVIRGPPASA